LMEQLDYNLLFRWFVGLSMDDPVWDVTVFTKNRVRLLAGDVAQGFLQQVVVQAQCQGLISAEHFTVDGTLIEAWAGHKSFKRKDHKQTPPDDPGNASSSDFHANGASMLPTNRLPTRKRDFIKRPAAKRPSSAIWATC
jgi:hypothetical protein